MYRKTAYIVGRIAGFLVVALMALLFAVQTPSVQTRITRIASEKLMQMMEGTVDYEELSIMPSGALHLKKVTIRDNAPYIDESKGWEAADTFFRAESITATFSLASLFRSEGIHFGRVSVEDGYMHLVTEPGSYETNLTRIFRIPEEVQPSEPGPEIFRIRKIDIRDFRFRLNNYLEEEYEYSGFGLNYSDLDIRVSKLKGHSMRFAGNRMYASCDELSLTEKSGYILNNLSGSCAVGMGKTMVEDLHLSDPWSEFRMKYFSMTYKDQEAFNEFINGVVMEGEFSRSSLAMRSIAYFSGAFQDSKAVLDISRGHAKGYVNDLAVNKLEFKDSHSQVQGRLSCRLLGLPDIDMFSIDGDIHELKFTTKGLSTFISDLSGSSLDFSQYAASQTFRLSAKAHGPLNRLAVAGQLNSGIGSVRIDADLRNLIDTSRAIEAKAQINTDKLDIGQILNSKEIGTVSLYAELGAVLKDSAEISLDSLKITEAKAIGTQFNDISAKARLYGGSLTADINSNDPKAKMNLSLLADLLETGRSNRYKINGKVENLDLFALGLDRRSPISRISLELDGDMLRKGYTIEGFLHLDNAGTENGSGKKKHGNMSLEAYIEKGEQCFKFGAPFADLFISGNGSIRDLIADIQNLTTRRELSAIYKDSTDFVGNGRYNLDLQLHDSRDILSFAMPGLYLADGTSLTMSIERNGELYGNVYSPRIALSNNYLREINLQFDNFNESLTVFVAGEELKAGSFAVNRPEINASADDNKLSMTGVFESFANAGGNGEIFIDGELYRDKDDILVVKAHPYDSYISTAEGIWRLSESDFTLHDKNFFIDRFSLSNGSQSIDVNGGISKERNDTLSIGLKRMDLALIDEFLSEKIGIEGVANGSAVLTSEQGRALGMLADIVMDSLSIGGTDAGKIHISSILEDEGESINLFIRNHIDGRDALYASGLYYLDDGRMDISAELDRISIALAGPFLNKLFDKTDGSLSGELRIQGMPGHLSTSSRDLRLENAKLGIAATGVTYVANGGIRVEDNGVYLENIDIGDESGGSALLKGSLTHRQLKDIQLDANLSLLNLKLLDVVTDKGTGIYGLLRASGNAGIQGPLDKLNVNADVRTVGDGNIHISTENSISSTSSELLVFTQEAKEIDPYEQMLDDFKQSGTKSGDIKLNAKISIHPGISAFVEIDKTNGNIASFSGNGNLAMQIEPARSIFNLNGDFNISEGNYHFVLPGIIDKVFTVQNGSSLKFAGDLLDTELNVDVLHSLQTSLNTIIPYSTTYSGTRRLVECGINISDRLRDPKVEFSINIPDLDPTTKSQVETALNTEDKIQKQFIALLLMGSFVPDEGSGVFNSSEVLFSNVSEIMSGQINSILEKLEIPLDVGIGYQGAYAGTNLFDVAISTQLFNNRVIVGGSVQNRRFGNAVSTSEVVGDLDIQIKLDKQGKFRLNLFSHSADEYSSFLDLSQRNGVGVSYQKEYNKIGDFFRSIFTARKESENEIEAEESVTIKIEEDERKAIPDTSAVRR